MRKAREGPASHRLFLRLLAPPTQLPTPVRPMGAVALAPTCVLSTTTGQSPAPVPTS